jgi:hypothetical protein
LAAAGKNVPSSIEFAGILFALVENLCALISIKCEVIYDPNEDDAHANIVIYDKGLDEVLTVTDALLETLTFVRPSQLTAHAEFVDRI